MTGISIESAGWVICFMGFFVILWDHYVDLSGFFRSDLPSFSSPSPIAEMKSIKNKVEIEGMKRSHIRDAVALCEYLMWLEHEVNAGTKLNETSAAAKLESFRAEQENYVSLR